MSNDKSKKPEERFKGLGGILGGLGSFVEMLGELAEKGEKLRKSGEFSGSGSLKNLRGVYGFSVKGLGDDEEGVSVEPFGNVHKDGETGKTVVAEVREPLIDIFEEQDHILVVAEMPGVGESEVKLELKEDILTLTAGKGDKKYHKEVLLPATFAPDKMSHTCRNGILEIKIIR